ncbi:MAG: CopG family transcriptional regulator [Brevefilum sp.]|nr:CopG family transcriptional regulator [Brevefilum sp.]
MERTQIMLEPEQKKILKKIADREERSFSELVREMLDEQIEQHQKAKLALAAQALLNDYTTDEELTTFTTLDGDDFHG